MERLLQLTRLFLRLGLTAFGGPVAHIAMMREEFVRRRGWVKDTEFLEFVGATALIPGPNSTELAMHLGLRRAGWRGLLIGGVCFIAPAAALVGLLGWLYERYGTDPTALDVRYGVLPVVIAIITVALWGLGRTIASNNRRPEAASRSALIAAGALAGYLLGFHELLILLGAGGVGVVWAQLRRLRVDRLRDMLVLPAAVFALLAVAAVPLWRLAAAFAEIGSVLYGSGYVLVAFLQRILVEDLGWITNQQVLDAITIGQVTPGPVLTTATFIGWQLHGPAGAAVATVAIFAPAFCFVALLGRIVPWTRRHPPAKAFLDGVTVASLGLMAGALVRLTDTAVVDLLTAIVTVVAVGIGLWGRLNSGWLIFAGATIGIIHAAI